MKLFNGLGGRRFTTVLLSTVIIVLKGYGIIPLDAEEMWTMITIGMSFILGESAKDLVAQLRAVKLNAEEAAK